MINFSFNYFSPSGNLINTQVPTMRGLMNGFCIIAFVQQSEGASPFPYPNRTCDIA